MKNLLVVLGVSILLSSCFVFGQSAEELLKSGDDAFDEYNHAAALQFYEKVIAMDSSNCEGLWKTTRAYIDLGETAEKDIQKNNYYVAEKIGRKAVAECPESDMAHLELAVAVGRVALMEGGKKKVRLSREIKAEALKALELNPQNDIAHHVLARWHREVANLSGMLKMFAKVLYGGLPDASNEKAVEHFKSAIENDPSFLNHYLELGMTYQKMDEWLLAKECFEKVIELPKTDSDDDDHKAEAQQRLEKVLKKL